MNPVTAIGVLVLLLVAAFVGGCYRGEHNGETDRLVLQAQAEIGRAELASCAHSLSSVNDATARGIAEADARAARGARAAADAEAEALRAQADAAAALEALARAKRTPTCAAQLEVSLCDSIPLL